MEITTERIIFAIAAAGALITAILMITRRNPVMSAIFLILNFFSVAVIYLLLKAQFIAIIQILVYMGAIMVLFLFVIMLLNLQDEKKFAEQLTYRKITAILIAILLAMLMGSTVYFGLSGKFRSESNEAVNIGTALYLGKELFTTYSFIVISAGLLLLAAIIGAVVLAKKNFE